MLPVKVPFFSSERCLPYLFLMKKSLPYFFCQKSPCFHSFPSFISLSIHFIRQKCPYPFYSFVKKVYAPSFYFSVIALRGTLCFNKLCVVPKHARVIARNRTAPPTNCTTCKTGPSGISKNTKSLNPLRHLKPGSLQRKVHP